MMAAVGLAWRSARFAALNVERVMNAIEHAVACHQTNYCTPCCAAENPSEYTPLTTGLDVIRPFTTARMSVRRLPPQAAAAE